MPCVVATLGKSIASVSRPATTQELGQSACANNGLDEASRTKQAFGEPGACLNKAGRATGEHVPQEEMAAEFETVANFGPARAAAFANEWRQGEELAGMWLGLRRTDSTSGPRAHGDQIVVGPAD